ncbi:MAG: large conductance mechanosensitive channel protein MscL [Agathobacter sp.]
MKKFIKEFKEFAVRGNMMDLAIGIIIGGAFTAIVGSLVNDIINPLLGLFIGDIDFSNLFIALDGNTYATLAEAEELGVSVFKYGSFISNVINFIIMALVVFILVKIINKLRTVGKKEEAPAAPTTKVCPFCQSEISIKATRCPHCTSVLEDTPVE